MELEKITNKSAKRYLRKVRSLLPCSRRMKDEITAPLYRSVAEYLGEQETVRAEDLRRRFGAPEVIAASCLEDADTTEILRRLRVKRKITAIAVAAVLLILLSWSCYLAYSYHELQNQVLEPTEETSDVEIEGSWIESAEPSST